MSLVAWLPRLRLHSLSIGLMLACLLAIWLGWSLTAQPKLDAMSAAWFEQTFAEEMPKKRTGIIAALIAALHGFFHRKTRVW